MSAVGPGTLVQLQNVTANFQAPLSALGAFIGGGGFIYEEDVNSGIINMTANVGTIALWNSPDAGSKTNYIPAATGSLQLITLVDVFGNAYTYNITPVPLAGSIVGNPAVYTNGGSITLLDTNSGWVEV